MPSVFTVDGDREAVRQVRPEFAEMSVRRTPHAASLRDHLLARYRNALAAICLAQLKSKGFQDGMQARSLRRPSTVLPSPLSS